MPGCHTHRRLERGLSNCHFTFSLLIHFTGEATASRACLFSDSSTSQQARSASLFSSTSPLHRLILPLREVSSTILFLLHSHSECPTSRDPSPCSSFRLRSVWRYGRISFRDVITTRANAMCTAALVIGSPNEQHMKTRAATVAPIN